MKVTYSLILVSMFTGGCAHLYGASEPEPLASQPVTQESARAPASVEMPKSEVKVTPCANDPAALFVKFSGESAGTMATFASTSAKPYPMTCSASECAFVMKNKKIMTPEKAHCAQ